MLKFSHDADDAADDDARVMTISRRFFFENSRAKYTCSKRNDIISGEVVEAQLPHLGLLLQKTNLLPEEQILS